MEVLLMSKIIFNLKKEFFLAIQSGEKKFEYRLHTDYWCKRLVDRQYDIVEFRMGYPKNDEIDKILSFKYNGYEIQEICHPFFGPNIVKVFAIIIK